MYQLGIDPTYMLYTKRRLLRINYVYMTCSGKVGISRNAEVSDFTCTVTGINVINTLHRCIQPEMALIMGFSYNYLAIVCP